MASRKSNKNTKKKRTRSAPTRPKQQALLETAQRQLEAGHPEQTEKITRQLLMQNPGHAQALCLLGRSLGEQGKLREGTDPLRHAIQINPDIAEPHMHMGWLAYQVNKFDQAARWLNQAIKRDPNLIEAHRLLGRVSLKGYNTEQAVASFQRAYELDPTDADTESRLADAYGSHGLSFKAIGHYENALKTCSEQAGISIRTNLAGALRLLGRFDEAQTQYDQVLAHDPNNTAALIGILDICESQSKHEEADRLLEQALQADIKHSDLAVTATRIYKRHGTPEKAVSYLTELLNQHPPLVAGFRLILHMTLGSVHEDMGQFDQAFTHYKKGNDLNAGHFAPQAYGQVIDDLISAFSADQMNNLPRARTGTTPTPIFIIGMPRSGTSLVERILSSHPMVYGAGELNQMILLALSLPERLDVKEPYPLCVDQLTPDLVNTLTDEYSDFIRTRSAEAGATDCSFVTDKMPHNFMHLGLIRLMYPEAKIIHCTRHPLDVCFSIYATRLSPTHPYAYQLDDVAVAYKHYRKLMDHWTNLFSTLDWSGFLELRYEEVVSDNRTQVERMLDFCGLDWCDACLQSHKQDRFTATASMDQVTKPIYKGSMNRYKRFEKHLDPLKNALADYLNLNEPRP